jgi:hypothetical protein
MNRDRIAFESQFLARAIEQPHIHVNPGIARPPVRELHPTFGVQLTAN